jgi:UDP-glucose 4-epimerase
MYLGMYEKLYGLDYVILRYGNVYGPRQDPLGEAGVVAIFAGLLLEGKKPTIFGDGKQTRDFVYVGDVVAANLLSLKKKTKHKVFNVGSGKPSSVNEITEKLVSATKSRIKPVHADPVAGEVRHIRLDISRAKKELGWTPKISLDAGLRKTVEWFGRG